MRALLCFVAAGLLLCYPALHAQDIESRLPGSSHGNGFSILDNSNTSLFTVRGTGRTGIGTNNPEFRLSLASDGGILARGVWGSGVSLPFTTDAVMFWYPKKAAFRAGYSYSGCWNDAVVGDYSFAGGYSTKANGVQSTAFGNTTVASGSVSLACGWCTEASGSHSTAFGTASEASGASSFAIGVRPVASGVGAIAMGGDVVASGQYSFAMGQDVSAAGTCAIGMGSQTTSSGSYSVAIGRYVSTNGHTGTMYLGDASATSLGTRRAYGSNHFYAVFHTGFSLFTDKSAGNTYCVVLQNHSTSWSSCSDSTKKENHLPADGESVLQQFSRLRLGSWNFIGHDPHTERHYGPIAQEWYSAFGHDGVGTIGCDTLLASADVDGVLCIAVQALEKRTSSNQKSMTAMKQQLDMKDAEIARLQHEMVLLRQENSLRDAQYRELTQLVRELQQAETKQDQHQAHLLNTEAGQ